jgi:RimJ/RimL family protein N-acetyltransferase
MPSLPECLQAGPIELRRWSLEYLDDVLVAVDASFSELHQWMEWAQSMPERDAIRGFLEHTVGAFDADEEWQYCVVEPASGTVVGGAGLRHGRDVGELEIGYWIRSDRCGRGYATEAARALTSAAFAAPLVVARVMIRMDRANLASASVPRKLGYHLDGEVEREVVTPGHTGTGLIWTTDRKAWSTST